MQPDEAASALAGIRQQQKQEQPGREPPVSEPEGLKGAPEASGGHRRARSQLACG